MAILGKLRGATRNVLHKQSVEAELNAEMQAYVEMTAAEHVAAGLPPEEARRRALAEFGGMEQVKQQVRDKRTGTGLELLVQDLRYALRQLVRSPGFALTALLTLTTAIAVNVIAFGVMNAVLLHLLPVPRADEVFSLQGHDASSFSFSWPNYEDIRDRNRTFAGIALIRLARVGLGTGSEATPGWGYEVSSNYFQTLDVQPVLGRFFVPTKEVKINGDPSAVLSYASWKKEFGGDVGIVGRTVRINKLPFVVIGVAPKGFNGTERLIWPKVWLPIEDEPEVEGYNWIKDRDTSNGWLVGRLKPGVTATQANADLATVAAQMGREYPDFDKDLELRVTRAGLFGDLIGGPAHAFLSGMLLMTLLVLFAACANLAGFFTARMTERARELGIRIAVGASRGRLLRQLLTESTLIAVAGGAAASVVATAALHALSKWNPSSDFPFEFAMDPGARVYLFSIGLALLTGALFGILPARQIWRTDPNRTLKAGTAAGRGLSRFGLRNILLGVQIALCCLLVTSAFVALRGLVRAFDLNIGVNPEHVTVAEMDLHLAGYTPEAAAAVQQRMLDAVRQIPGVEDAAVSNSTPLSANQSSTGIFSPGTTAFNDSTVKFSARYYEVGPGYFRTAGTQLLRGRELTPDDNAHAPSVAVVNETFAKKLFGTTDVVGRTFPRGKDKQVQIVGVVEDGKYATLTEDPTAAIFWPLEQMPDSSTVLLVRSQRPEAEMVPAVRRAIADVDPAVPVLSLSSWRDALDFLMLPERAATVALGALGAIAVLLAITGIFGLTSYTVSRRMRELGIRVALGAKGADVLRSALGPASVLLGLGSAAGLALGFVGNRVMASIVYRASAFDPVVIAAVVCTMMAVGVLAAFWPARRALAADPAILLRED